MNVELISVKDLFDNGCDFHDWAVSFIAKIDGVEVKGKAFNFRDPRKKDASDSFNIKVRFEDSRIRKDPKYQEIRGKLLTEISKDPDAKRFCTFTPFDYIK